jgi:GTP-binding protein
MAQAPSDHGAAGLREPILAQIRLALTEADAVVFLVDARAGIHPLDREIANDLRRLGKPVTLAVNKSEGLDGPAAAAEFHALGLGAPWPISSAHGEGVEELMTHALARLPLVPPVEPVGDVPRIAVIGRPNAGKSTLVNALAGEERVIVSPEPGTTRDSIAVPLERAGKNYLLIDTAGLRRRARVSETLEKFSAIKTLQALDEANVIVLVLDAAAGIGEQDATLAGYALKRGRALVIAVNKWDALIEASARDWAKREVERKLPFLDFAPVHYISALQGHGIGSLFASVDRAFASANRDLPTPRLNRVLQAATAATPPPVVRGRRVRLKFAHQGGKNPPVVVVHGNQVKSLTESYRRYLARAFQDAFGLVGTPVVIHCREGDNPYEGRPKRRRGRRPQSNRRGARPAQKRKTRGL